MNQYSDGIRKALKELVGMQYDTFPATVVKINEQDGRAESVDVKPLNSGAEIFDVRLKAALDGQNTGVVIVPALNSTVLVTKIGGDENECFLSMVSQAQEIRVQIGDISYFIDDQSVVFNEGKFGGLIKIEELKKELAKIVQYLDAIKQVFSAWVPAPGDGGAALKALMNSTLSPLPKADFGQIEDDKVKH